MLIHIYATLKYKIMEENKKCCASGKSIILGVSIILAAAVLGILMVQMVRTLKSFDDTVSVRGLCEKEVPADRIVYRVNYSSQSNSLAELRTTMKNNDAIIIRKLKEAGLDDSEIVYTPATFSDRYADSYYYSTDRIAYRYNAHQNISVYTTKANIVEKLSNLEADLLNEDIIVSAYTSYEYNGLNEIKPAMIAESLEKARESAEEFAKNSHSKIGKMKTASQGYFSVEDLDENNPQIKKVRVVTTVEYYLK